MKKTIAIIVIIVVAISVVSAATKNTTPSTGTAQEVQPIQLKQQQTISIRPAAATEWSPSAQRVWILKHQYWSHPSARAQTDP